MGALEEFPGQLTLRQAPTPSRTWILTIDSADLWGECASSSKEMLLAIAEAYAAMRRDQAAKAAGS